jgi:uncharacterized phiE125 gp8 family phage protein
MSYGNRFGRLSIVTAPAAEPISTATAKEWLRIESGVTADDTLIDALVVAARQHVEEYCQIRLITQTVRQTLDRWPGYRANAIMPNDGRISDWKNGEVDYVELIARPVQSITSVTLYDDAGNSDTWASSNYRLSAPGDRSRLVPTDNAAWPSAERRSDAIEIVYVAGFGNAGSDVPDAILKAMKLLVAHWYENREAVVIGTITAELPFAVKALLQPYRFITI